MIAALVVASFAAAPVFAQQAAPEPAKTDYAASKKATEVENDSHTRAIEEFFAVINLKQSTDRTIDEMLEMQIQQQPQLASFEDVMLDFLRKHVSYVALKDDIVQLYKAEFSEEEIREMTAFYRTPVGQKAVKVLPALVAAGAQLGLQRVQANMGDLQKAIEKRQAELQNQ